MRVEAPGPAGGPDRRRRSPWVREEALVLAQDQGGPDWFRLLLRAPRIAPLAWPGQFLQVAVRPVATGLPGPAGAPDLAGSDPLLPRPLSICTLDPEGGSLSVVYRVAGRGTALLASARPGERLALLGPLGLSFPDPGGAASRPLHLVGGGLGIPPLACAAAWARAGGRRPQALLGARGAAGLAGAAEVAACGAPVQAVTEDGSAGVRGLVTDVLRERLAPGDEVWSCGPPAMLAAVQRLCAAQGAEAWLCVERAMACGFGVCLGCAVARSDGGGFLRACVDGPVFRAGDVDVAEPRR